MKKIFIPVLVVLLMSFGSVHPVTEVKAVNVLLTVRTLTYDNMTVIQAYLKLNKTNWFSDYNYYMWYYGTQIILTLIPKNNANQLIFADNQVDAVNQDDIDTWTLYFSCSTQSPCLQYHFNGTTFAYASVDNISTASNVYDVTSSPIYYTNVTVWTYLSQVVPPYLDTTQKTTLAGANYGILPFPTDWTVKWGYVEEKTDNQLADKLINANWGMFNFLKDGLNEMFAWVIDTLDIFRLVVLAGLGTVLDPIGDILAGLFTPSQQFINDLYPRYAEPITLKLGFLWYPFEWFGGLVSSITGSTVSGTFTFGNLFGAPLKLDMTGFKNGAPQVWNFVLLLIRGTLSYELISGFYHKVTSKMKGTS